MRGFVIDHPSEDYDENGELTMKGKIREEMVRKLASEWNEYHSKMEQRSWRSEHEIDDEADYLAERCGDFVSEKMADFIKNEPGLSEEDYEEYHAYHHDEDGNWRCKKYLLPMEARQLIEEKESSFEKEFYADIKKKESEDGVRIQVIEELLSGFNARMMRPYEHWNEDEKLMEYLERDRDNE